MRKIITFIKSVLFPVVVGLLVGIIISDNMDYQYLIKPEIAPKPIVFPIVWIILYVLMGVSYGILKYQNMVDAKTNLIYNLQLAVNALWPIIFFVLKWRLIAFIWIFILALIIVVMIDEFYSKNKISGLLQFPYLIWTIFAAYLNISIYLLNNSIAK